MKTSPTVMLKQLQEIEEALQQIVQPQIVRRVVDEDAEAVLDRMIADGEIAEAQRDDVLVILSLSSLCGDLQSMSSVLVRQSVVG